MSLLYKFAVVLFVPVLTIEICLSSSVKILEQVEIEHTLIFQDNIDMMILTRESNKTEHVKMAAEMDKVHKRIFSHQLVDHFNRDETGLWAQPYYVDFSFQQSKSGPIFFEIGGEWNISDYPNKFGRVFTDQITKDFKAGRFSLQHRYYAPDAIPLAKADKVAVHSSQQALADAAYFIEKIIRQEYKLTGPIVISGCSYGGSLATWFRKKYPHYVNGSVALSAPLLAKLEYREYMNDGVAIAKQVLPECTEKILDFQRKITSELSTTDPEEFLAKFGWCPLNVNLAINKSEAATFLLSQMLAISSNLIVSFPQAQHILTKMKKTICPRMNFDPYSAVKFTVQDFFNETISCKSETWDSKCMDTELILNSTFNEEMCNSRYTIRNTTGQDSFSTFYEAWYWQKCSEFGFFKTVIANTTAAEVLTPNALKNFLKTCKVIYGLSPENVTKLVEQTNVLYGGWDMNSVSKLLVVNGAYDPWSSLSLPPTERVDFNGVTSVIMEAEHHCPDASEYVRSALKHWLA